METLRTGTQKLDTYNSKKDHRDLGARTTHFASDSRHFASYSKHLGLDYRNLALDTRDLKLGIGKLSLDGRLFTLDIRHLAVCTMELHTRYLATGSR